DILQCFQVGDQIGKVLGAESLSQATGHQGDVAPPAVVNLVLGDLDQPGIGVLDLDGVLGLGPDDPGEDAAIGQRKDGRLVARGNPGRGIQHGGDQLVAGILGSDAGELGSDGASFPAHGMALDAGQALEVAEQPAAMVGTAPSLECDGTVDLG